MFSPRRSILKCNHANEPLTSLYNPSHSNIEESDLLRESEHAFTNLSISHEEEECLSLSTILQSKSPVWFKQKKGRITAHLFEAVCHTSLSRPLQTTITRILQAKHSPRAASLMWGIDNEERSRLENGDRALAHHKDFDIDVTGLHVNPIFPHLDAKREDMEAMKVIRYRLLYCHHSPVWQFYIAL